MASNGREWTLAVDLAVNLKQSGEQGHLGAEEKMARLKQLQAQTKDSPVTIVAQQIVPQIENGKRSFILKRYAIHDNQIDDISPNPAESKGTAQDLTDILRVAGEKYPSAKLGLVTNSHGNGDQGLMGDHGDVSLPKLQQAIKDGLKGSGHDKLDLLNFDACLMAQVGVLDKMAPVAKQLIASQTIEHALSDSNVDGQNLNAWIGDLLQKPGMDGKDLARDIVRNADRGSNNLDGNSGTDTLAHFNLEQPFDQFEKSFDHYADALKNASLDPKNRDAIRSAIDASQGPMDTDHFFSNLNGLTPSRYKSKLKDEKGDLGKFSSAIDQLIKSGKISDPDSSLARASAKMEADQKAMTEEFHGPKSASGLSVFLPSTDHLDTSKVAERSTAVGQILEMTDPKTPIGVRSLQLPNLDDELRILQKQMANDPDASEALRSISTSRAALRKLNKQAAPDDHAVEMAESALRASVIDLKATSTFKHEMGERQTQVDHVLSGQEKTQAETGKKSWTKFLDAVC